MTTFREIVYMCMDLLKESSGDSYYTEEHILFLVKKMRAMLLEKKYKQTRNSPFLQVSEENKQRVCFAVDVADDISVGCGGRWIKSRNTIPELMNFESATTCTVNDMLSTMVTFIPKERMQYTGYNKWLKNIIYAARSVDGHIYLSSSNPQFTFLEKAGITGVFSDPEEAIKANNCSGEESCTNIMDEVFPLEEALITSCVELVVQELTGARFAPQDKKNDSSDNLPESVSIKSSPVNSQQRVEQ